MINNTCKHGCYTERQNQMVMFVPHKTHTRLSGNSGVIDITRRHAGGMQNINKDCVKCGI